MEFKDSFDSFSKKCKEVADKAVQGVRSGASSLRDSVKGASGRPSGTPQRGRGGAASGRTRALLRKKGIHLDACFDIRMPATWTPVFDLSDPDNVAETNRRAEAQIEELQEQVRNRTTGKHMGLTAPLFAGRFSERLYDKQRVTSSLSVDGTCIGCGLCVKKCPVRAIELRDKKPVWVKETCVLCLGCLHRCPTFSIQRGSNTRKHGQYVNPHVKI